MKFPIFVPYCEYPIPLCQLSDFGVRVRKIGFVCVVSNKTLLAMFASVALFTCTTFTTFDNIV